MANRCVSSSFHPILQSLTAGPIRHAERGSPWPERAELLAQQGIRLLDWQGVEWRQRLK